MKLFSLLVLLSSFSAQAANVVSAKLDASQENILLDVVYGGGCVPHTFSLRMGFCGQWQETMKCTAYLMEEIEGGVDMCGAIKHETAVLNIEKNGLDEYRGSVFTIYGDRSFNGVQTAVSLWIPLKD